MITAEKLLDKTLDWLGEHDQAWMDYVEYLEDEDKEFLETKGYEFD